MPRPKRVLVENGWYHVFNRGISRKTICFDDYHFSIFKQVMCDLYEKYNIEVHAYCMMKNHYHILLHTHNPNLSEGMCHFGRVFSKTVNKIINGDGPLFRDRFKSILIQDDQYLLQVHRYIHLNPVEAGLSIDPFKYEWSSCKFFRPSNEYVPSYLNLNFLNRFKSDEEYEDYMNLGNGKLLRNFYANKKKGQLMNSSIMPKG